ncbi:uncharacterized protein LOC115228121 [Octopus sinensis]|uniref:Uncharacterized protein LOC115228113 n=1 Tax=Octopus sinensis TaxID=2607531 RepID=A0A6P7TZE8_9MOLL|nr:uncharacterized protein LOC115228113 [Octopus sinensis]XP_029654642.1 uncharacterized protein LOC115228121 [Octopus sinensis]
MSQASKLKGLPMIFELLSLLPEFEKEYSRGSRQVSERIVCVEGETVGDEPERWGTPVTVESFSRWKVQFEKEMSESQECIVRMTGNKCAECVGKEFFAGIKDEEDYCIEEGLFDDMDIAELDCLLSD